MSRQFYSFPVTYLYVEWHILPQHWIRRYIYQAINVVRGQLQEVRMQKWSVVVILQMILNKL